MLLGAKNSMVSVLSGKDWKAGGVRRLDYRYLGRLVSWLDTSQHVFVFDIEFYPSSPLKSACLKYFMPTHATTTHTQAMTHVKTSKAG